MYKEYGERVAFLVVYIREAHPSDGRQTRSNERAGIVIKQPTSFDQRQQVAQEMCTQLKLSLPAVIDNLDDKVSRAYSAMPDRLYLVGTDGRIVYQGERGPRGFKPAELEKAILATWLEK